MAHEIDADRDRRRAQRVLFDSVADLYDRVRASYPDEIVDRMITTAGVGPDDPVLEVGCGTGQLTRQLAPRGFELTAIDLAPASVDTARHHLPDGDVGFVVTTFEDLDAPDSSFALITSATAFHWIDPEVAWTKSATLLRPGGWIAVLETVEHYADPFGSAMRQLWKDLSPDRGGRWADRPHPTQAEKIAASGLFDEAVEHQHDAPRSLPADVVYGLEHTRATSLSFDDPTRSSFSRQLRTLLDPTPEVALVQHTGLTMARRRD